jgi:hypothetical protein
LLLNSPTFWSLFSQRILLTETIFPIEYSYKNRIWPIMRGLVIPKALDGYLFTF